MANIVYIATSLDGFIAKKDGSLDWLTEYSDTGQGDFGFAAFMDSVDAVIMGRKTFDTVVAFGEWPYSRPVYVLSNNLVHLPDGYEDRCSIVKGELMAILSALHGKGMKNIYVDGGRTIQGFLKEGLIDELIITRVPVLLGDGIPLFAGPAQEIKLEHAGTEVLAGQLVRSHYKRKE